mmetsp:Transcript_24239/g.55451  ORF Transcript_24239/g.55451 Transcript_24239/m.55451 type:complete len:444 (+) Transcript_24239:736-2067(+)
MVRVHALLQEVLDHGHFPICSGHVQAGAPVVVGQVRVGAAEQQLLEHLEVRISHRPVELGRARRIAEPERGATAAQYRHDGTAAVAHRLQQRRDALVVLRVGLRAFVEQQLGNGRIPHRRRHVEAGPPVLLHRVGVTVELEQLPDDVDLTLAHGSAQLGAHSLARVPQGALERAQHLRRRHLALLEGVVQRRVAVAVGHVHVRLVVDEQLHHHRVPRAGGEVQRRPPGVVGVRGLQLGGPHVREHALHLLHLSSRRGVQQLGDRSVVPLLLHFAQLGRPFLRRQIDRVVPDDGRVRHAERERACEALALDGHADGAHGGDEGRRVRLPEEKRLGAERRAEARDGALGTHAIANRALLHAELHLALRRFPSVRHGAGGRRDGDARVEEEDLAADGARLDKHLVLHEDAALHRRAQMLKHLGLARVEDGRLLEQLHVDVAEHLVA